MLSRVRNPEPGPAAAPGRLSRRGMLRRGAAGGLLAALAGSLALSRRALANAKMSKRDAEYKDAPQGGVRCDRCSHFQPPENCDLVLGAVSPQGSCDLFAPKKK